MTAARKKELNDYPSDLFILTIMIVSVFAVLITSNMTPGDANSSTPSNLGGYVFSFLEKGMGDVGYVLTGASVNEGVVEGTQEEMGAALVMEPEGPVATVPKKPATKKTSLFSNLFSNYLWYFISVGFVLLVGISFIVYEIRKPKPIPVRVVPSTAARKPKIPPKPKSPIEIMLEKVRAIRQLEGRLQRKGVQPTKGQAEVISSLLGREQQIREEGKRKALLQQQIDVIDKGLEKWQKKKFKQLRIITKTTQIPQNLGSRKLGVTLNQIKGKIEELGKPGKKPKLITSLPPERQKIPPKEKLEQRMKYISCMLQSVDKHPKPMASQTTLLKKPAVGRNPLEQKLGQVDRLLNEKITAIQKKLKVPSMPVALQGTPPEKARQLLQKFRQLKKLEKQAAIKADNREIEKMLQRIILSLQGYTTALRERAILGKEIKLIDDKILDLAKASSMTVADKTLNGKQPARQQPARKSLQKRQKATQPPTRKQSSARPLLAKPASSRKPVFRRPVTQPTKSSKALEIQLKNVQRALQNPDLPLEPKQSAKIIPLEKRLQQLDKALDKKLAQLQKQLNAT